MSQSPATSGSQSKEPARPKTSGLAVASLVCGIAGIVTVGLSAIVGLILGIIALSKIGKSAGQLTGRGLAIAGIVLAAITLFFLLVPVAVVMVVIFSGWLIPSDPGPYLEQARGHFEKEEYNEAWVSVRNAMRYGARKDPDAWYLLAQIAMRQAPPAIGDARHAYQSALMFNPDFFDAQRDLAELNVALRDWAQVTKDTARLIEMDPSFGRAYVWAALAEVGVADAEPIYQNRVPHYEAAVKHLLAGIQHAPDLLDLYHLLAQTYLRMEQAEKVDEVLDLAVANNPKMAEAYVLRANRLIAQDRVDDAIEVLRRGLEKAGDHAVLLLALGEAAARENESDSAKEFFKKAISADPKIEVGYLRLATLYRIEAEQQAALDLLEQGLKALPDSVPLKAEQADIHLELRDVEKADALIKEVSETAPDAAMGALREAQGAASMNNMRQLCMAANLYAMDHDDTLPPADSWQEEVLPYAGDNEDLLADPSEPDAGRAYAMNARLSDFPLSTVRNADRTVLFFECRFGAPPGGGPELLPDQPRHPGGYVIGFVDGHVEGVAPQETDDLIWDPDREP